MSLKIWVVNLVYMKKYELTNETIEVKGHILHRIRHLKTGELGGWVESEENLSQEGYGWVYSDAQVYGNARVCGDVLISGNARLWGNIKVYDDPQGSGGCIAGEV